MTFFIIIPLCSLGSFNISYLLLISIIKRFIVGGSLIIGIMHLKLPIISFVPFSLSPAVRLLTPRLLLKVLHATYNGQAKKLLEVFCAIFSSFRLAQMKMKR